MLSCCQAHTKCFNRLQVVVVNKTSMNLRQLWHIHVLEKKTLKAVTRVFVKRHFASFLRTEKMMNCQR